MRYRFGVVLAGAVLASAGMLAGGVGSAGATTVSPSPSPTLACPPVVPISGAVSAVTATSVTISYSIFLRPPCGYNPPVTVTLFASREEALQWQNPVAEAVSGPQTAGTVTLDGLRSDTEYWYRFSAGGNPIPYLTASVRTAPLSDCAATMVIDNRWGGGFVATVAVRNVGDETLGSWYVSWRWSGAERIEGLWGAVEQGSGADVRVGNASYNGRLAPGASTSFGMLVAGGAPPAGLAVTCGR